MNDRILIAGAGIGGLSAALALRQAGFAATVIERATEFSRSAGAGISVTAPASAALDALGLAEGAVAISDPAPATEILHYRTGETVQTRVVPNLEAGAPEVPNRLVPRVTHRADLHDLLLGACETCGVELIIGAELTGFRQDATGVCAVLADGRAIEGAILIGADGLRSKVRALIHGDSAPRHTGAVAWRALVPVDLVGDLLGGLAVAIHAGPTAHVMRYLVRQGTMLNCVALVRTDAHAQDGWSTPSTSAELAHELRGWHETLLELVHRIPDGTMYKWPLLDRDPITRWVDGRIALFGDAAHPMLPYYGIGAAIAMEDAVILGRAMAASPDPVAGLKLYERSRVDRANGALLGSRRLGEAYAAGSVLDVITQPVVDWGLYAYDPRTAPLG